MSFPMATTFRGDTSSCVTDLIRVSSQSSYTQPKFNCFSWKRFMRIPLTSKQVSGLRTVLMPSKSKDQSEGGGLTYKDAAVDIDAGSELVRRIAKMAPGIGSELVFASRKYIISCFVERNLNVSFGDLDEDGFGFVVYDFPTNGKGIVVILENNFNQLTIF